MWKIPLIIILLFTAAVSSAQIREMETPIIGMSPSSTTIIRVEDKKNKQSMAGAAVFLSCREDTLKTVTDHFGLAVFPDLPFREGKDTLDINISFLGYKPLEYKYVHKHIIHFLAEMEEDPEQLAEIIVQADALAMVVHGDTTIFNAAAYSVMEGDNLGKLLEQLPGISMSDGKLYANGKPVKKILLNGNAIFDTNTEAALNLIKYDDIKKVKVYDQYDQNRLIEADTLGMKESVVDIETKKSVNVIRRTRVRAAAGIYRDRNKDGGRDFSGGAGADFNRYGIDMPSYSINASLGYNQSRLTPADSPGKNAEINFYTNGNEKFKSKYTHYLQAGYNDSRSENFSKDTYTRTDFFDSKESEQSSMTGSKSLNAAYTDFMGWALGERNSLNIHISLSYNHMWNRNLNNTRVVTDNVTSLSDVYGTDCSGNFNGTAGLSFEHSFRKENRRMAFSIEGGYNASGGNDSRVDTSSTTTVPQWILGTLKGNGGHFTVSASYWEPLSERFSLSLNYQLKADMNDQEKLSFDRLMEWTDTLQTYNYRHSEIANTASAGIRFMNRRKNFNIYICANYEASRQTRDDRFPEALQYRRLYQHISPHATISYSGSKFTFNLSYLETQTIPAVDDTRKKLDDSSPLFIVTGNPELKQAISRNLSTSVDLVIPKAASQLSANIVYSNTHNAASRKTVYFNEETYIPEYDYYAPAGSQMSTPVNVKDMHNLFSSIRWSTRITRLKTTVRLGPSYRWTDQPFITGEECHVTGTHAFSIDFGVNTNISKYAEIALSSSTSAGLNQLDGEKVYRSLTEDLNCRVRVNMFKFLWLNSDFTWNRMGTDSDMATGYRRYLLNAGISWKFGKERIFEIGANCYDLLNRNNSWTTSINDNFVSSKFSTIYGTSYMLRFNLEF